MFCSFWNVHCLTYFLKEKKMAYVELLGEKLVSGDGDIDTSSIDADVVGIYFSAHWCPPCRSFTPVLADAYNKITGAGKKLAIVFVSSDRSDDAFEEYFNEMPWLAIPFDNKPQMASLAGKFEVRGIPTLILVDREGKTVSTDGRRVIMSDPEGAQFPWKE